MPEPVDAVRQGFYGALNYGGVELGYQSDPVSTGFRTYFTEYSTLVGLRLRHHLFDYKVDDLPGGGSLGQGTGNLYYALDGYRIDYEGEITKGTGSMYGITGGIQHPLSNHVTLNADMGPYYGRLYDRYSNQSTTDTHFILNLGLQFHL